MANKRYFEFVGGGSKKFWEITRKAASVTVRFGRIGSDGQEKTKFFRSGEDAKDEYDKLIKEKLGKGYADPTADVSDSDHVPDHPDDDVQEEPEFRVKRLPARRGKTLGWGAFGAQFGYKMKRKLAAKWERAMEKATGLKRLPPSYLEYQRRLEAAGEWIRAVRGNKLPYYLNIYSSPVRLKDERQRHVERLKADYTPPKVREKYGQLIPFGSDASRTAFCWNPAEIDRRGEPAIYELDFDGVPKVTRLAGDLLELLQSYKPHYGG